MLWSDLERFGSMWNPWREFDHMERTLSKMVPQSKVEFPAVNVWVAENSALVTTEIPGVDPQAIDISAVGKSLTLRGSRPPEELREGETYHRRERWYGQFTKIIELPFHIQVDRVNARFSRGVLSIELPRADAEKPRKITVKSG